MNKISKILLTLTVLAMLTASASAQTLELYAKYAQDPIIDPWDINACDNAPNGTLTYSLTGSATWSFTANNLKDTVPYVLIYYADPWPGTNGAVIGTGTSTSGGDLTISGIAPPSGNIPVVADDNNPLGGKIWLVTASDYSGGSGPMSAWNPKDYLFEHEGGLNYVSGSAAAVEITAGEVGVDAAGTSIKLPIDMSTTNTVSSIQLEIDYSQVIISGGTISVNGVATTLGSSFEWNDNPSSEIITISIMDSIGLSGDLTIAEIDFNIGPATSGESILYGMSLTAEVTDNADPSALLSSAVDNGYIWIESEVIIEVVGDEDADGYVTAADALEYLKRAADSSYAGDFDDICGTSSGITAWDALMVLQASTSGATLTICP